MTPLFDPTTVERIWFGSDPSARAIRLAVRPFSGLYRVIVGSRNLLYDSGRLRVHETSIPALSVGNLTVGGTGKTPVAAWIASRLRSEGARPAIVLRGYGDDEPLVHRLLNPGVPVIVAPDRVRGVEEAASLGASIAVLDDAFQHRRVRRVADIVLISADRGLDHASVLPAGPFREPLGALGRASMVLVTRKAASELDAHRVAERVHRIAPAIPVGIVHLALGGLRRVRLAARRDEKEGPLSGPADAGTSDRPLDSLAGRRVLAVAALGEPEAFLAQLRAAGANVEPAIFPDHYMFAPADIERVIEAARGMDSIVCTLKDAVKLAPRWPREAPALWYVTQVAALERGSSYLDDVLRRAASHHTTQS